jgi:AraC-like DNA-binding protein
MEAERAGPDRIYFKRSADLAGVELMDALRTSANLRWFHTAFGIGLAGTWHGQVEHARRRYEVAPGMALCTEPGDLHVNSLVIEPGSISAFMIEERVLRDALEEHGALGSLHWNTAVAALSPELVGRLGALSRSFDPETSALERQSAFVELVEVIARQRLERPLEPRRTADAAPRAVERIREQLRDEPDADLHALTQATGLSRFQVLRAFKRRYGLPPHAYGLCVRIARARHLLARGAAAVDVAHACGFVDQSHFTRHFKRLVGVTPAAYGNGRTGN